MSALSPAVGPKVVSEAGEPASPRAAAAAITITEAGTLSPRLEHKGTNSTARMGMVPNDVPIPMVIKSPSKSISETAINFECCM